MKILLAGFLFHLLSATVSAQTTFSVLTPKVNQGEVAIIKIAPQWQGSLVCISTMNRDFYPNQFGTVFIGTTPNTQPGKYALFLVECGRGVRLDWNNQEIEVVKKKFPETRMHIKMATTDSSRRKKEAGELNQAYAKGNGWFERTDGKFVMPLDNILVTDPFGKKRIYLNGQTWHSGVDLRAPVGTAVKAVNSGVVLLTANNFSLEGNIVIIDHGSGIFSLYLHLSKVNAVQGTKIKKGEILGLSGVTGSATGPHLHFIIKANGTNVDPLIFIDTINQYLK